MSIPSLTLASILSVFLVLSTANAVDNQVLIKHHYVKKSNMTENKYFCLHPEQNDHHEHIDEISPTMKSLMVQHIIHAFQKSGYIFTLEDNCQIEIGYEIYMKHRKLLHPTRYEHIVSNIKKDKSSPWFRDISQIPDRSMTLHAYDHKSNRTVWVLTAEEVIFDDDKNLQTPEAVRDRASRVFSALVEYIPSSESKG